MLDTSRTSAGRVARAIGEDPADGMPRLDAAMDAALLLGALASRAGDRIDFLAGDRRVRARQRHPRRARRRRPSAGADGRPRPRARRGRLGHPRRRGPGVRTPAGARRTAHGAGAVRHRRRPAARAAGPHPPPPGGARLGARPRARPARRRRGDRAPHRRPRVRRRGGRARAGPPRRGCASCWPGWAWTSSTRTPPSCRRRWRTTTCTSRRRDFCSEGAGPGQAWVATRSSSSSAPRSPVAPRATAARPIDEHVGEEGDLGEDADGDPGPGGQRRGRHERLDDAADGQHHAETESDGHRRCGPRGRGPPRG